MSLAHVTDQFFLTSPFLASADHDRGAMSIVGTNVDAAVATHLLKTNPNVRLDIFHQMSDVNRAIRVWKSTGDEYFACHESMQLVNR